MTDVKDKHSKQSGKGKSKKSQNIVNSDEIIANAVKKFAPAERIFTAEEYSDVVSAAKLQRIVLVNSAFNVDPEIFSGVIGMEKCHLSISRKCLDAAFHPDDGVGVGMFEFGAVAFRKEAKDEGEAEPLLEIRTAYMVLYDGLTDLKEAAVVEFVRRVGMMAAYPYFRNIAGQYGWASSVDLPIMPVLR